MNAVPNAKTRMLYLAAFAISIFFSYWVDIRTLVINPDAICYLFSAETMTDGLQAAIHLCPQAKWPFYSMLIYAVANFLHITALNAAYMIDGLFSAISVVAFIACVRQLADTKRMMLLAAIVILMAHHFNILRSEIIRDHGFWAGYLASIYFLLRFFKTHAKRYAYAWGLSLIVATCFRIEGIIFLVALPWLAWFESGQSFMMRLNSFIKLNTFLLLGCLALAVRLMLHPTDWNQLGRLPEVIAQLQHGLDLVIERYQVTKAAVSTNVLTHVSLRDAGIVVALLTIIWYFVNVVSNLSLIYSLLVVYSWVTRSWRFAQGTFVVVLGYLLVNLTVTFIFFAQTNFLAKRYLIGLSLVLMFWVPFALSHLMSSRLMRHRILLAVACVYIAISGISGLFHFGHSKDYIRKAGDWLAAHVSDHDKLYTNDYQLMYYSQHEGHKIFETFNKYSNVTVIAHGQWQSYDYLALMKGNEGDDQTAHVMQELHMAPIEVFVSSNGSHIYIYKVMHRGR